ncbi:MAG: PIN domain-containing protein [Actinobacteria bacterium]|nr:PIN domain-containing protein [Actinomycetota bacterium]MCL5986375.1 PIN domain-containing protein [Actinomycetota bacterium]
MNLDDLRAGSRVFIDSNIFIYHFIGSSDSSTNFLLRCSKGELIAYTSLNVILEVMHKLMQVEAVQKNAISSGDMVKKLRSNPDAVKNLSDYYSKSGEIEKVVEHIIPLSYDDVRSSQRFRDKYGLLMLDSLIAHYSFSFCDGNLASNDNDFERVSELNLFYPGVS